MKFSALVLEIGIFRILGEIKRKNATLFSVAVWDFLPMILTFFKTILINIYNYLHRLSIINIHFIYVHYYIPVSIQKYINGLFTLNKLY